MGCCASKKKSATSEKEKVPEPAIKKQDEPNIGPDELRAKESIENDGRRKFHDDVSKDI